MRYAVLFEKTDTGYSAHVPDLPGCVAAGSTLEETTELIRGAIRMHLAYIAEDGRGNSRAENHRRVHRRRVILYRKPERM